MITFLPPRRRRRAFFMLTPLVDVMFLLLIFFMLSSQTSLYTLVRISAQAVSGETAPAAAPASTAELLVGIGQEQVRINGVATALADLPAALAGYQMRGIDRAALVAGQSARVQDIVSVLELFEAARFGRVRLVAGASP